MNPYLWKYAERLTAANSNGTKGEINAKKIKNMTKQEFDEIVIPLSFIDNPKHRQFIKDAVNGNFNRWVKKRNEINILNV